MRTQVFLGDQSVGKTSIITRFMYDKFDNTYQVRKLVKRVQLSVHAPDLPQLLLFGGMHPLGPTISNTGHHRHRLSL